MKRSVVVLAVLGFVAAARVAQAAGDEKFAFVDLQRALEETKEGKAARAKLKDDFDKKQKELDVKQDELRKLKDNFDKKSALMKPEALQKEQQDLQARFVQLQETYARLQRDLAGKEDEATRGILQRLGMVVQKIAERDRFVMVFERHSLAYGQPALDITNEVIRLYDAQSSIAKSK